jgi:ribose transport system substrate-binding protein
VQNGAADAAKEFDVELLWSGPARETDVSRQVEILDSMIGQGVDAIAIAACDRTELVPAVERAAARGIPITVFDSSLDFDGYVSHVATDNIEAGRAAARKMAEMLNGRGSVGMVLHAPGSASTMDRERGFTDTLAREFPALKIEASEHGFADPGRSRTAAEKMLDAHPSIVALFASSEPSSVGAANAIKARKLEAKVLLVAFDSSEAMVDDLRSGAIDAMLVQDPQRMGYEAVKTLVMKLNGQTPPRRLDLNAIIVQKKDLNEPNVKRLLNFT